mmetsp:Transcript_10738/g.37584  ORF Transcript_10738/g.37584 Transcript_10738/m.37584 type:complete len:238 (+) Transcript_10738:793-1506(+)
MHGLWPGPLRPRAEDLVGLPAPRRHVRRQRAAAGGPERQRLQRRRRGQRVGCRREGDDVRHHTANALACNAVVRARPPVGDGLRAQQQRRIPRPDVEVRVQLEEVQAGREHAVPLAHEHPDERGHARGLPHVAELRLPRGDGERHLVGVRLPAQRRPKGLDLHRLSEHAAITPALHGVDVGGPDGGLSEGVEHQLPLLRPARRGQRGAPAGVAHATSSHGPEQGPAVVHDVLTIDLL